MLTIHNARMDYPGHTAFSQFSLTVGTGEMVSVIGKSGCGKTSLLYAITGLIELTEGSIQVDGGPQAIGIMFQQDRLLPWRTVLENVLLGLGIGADNKDRGEQLLQRMGLADKGKKYPDQLSGGERQRVALVRALIRRPRLLLLDEPLGSLDEQNRERLQDEIKAYVLEHGMTLLMVTHSIQEAVYMGSRILIMTPVGIPFETHNPWHVDPDLRNRDEFFALGRTLRAKLGGQD
jgi:ABC-type nitrate/sulfonate/bicarbonate transport system ATPase subunit